MCRCICGVIFAFWPDGSICQADPAAAHPAASATQQTAQVVLSKHLQILCAHTWCNRRRWTKVSIIPGEGRVLPYLGMVGKLRGDDPQFWNFRSDWVPIICIIMIWLTPSLSLSHLVPEICEPKFCIMFHKMLLFNRFWAFCINFLLDFRSNWPPFSLILDLLTSYFFQNLRSDWVQFVISCWILLQKIWRRTTKIPSITIQFSHITCVEICVLHV